MQIPFSDSSLSGNFHSCKLTNFGDQTEAKFVGAITATSRNDSTYTARLANQSEIYE